MPACGKQDPFFVTIQINPPLYNYTTDPRSIFYANSFVPTQPITIPFESIDAPPWMTSLYPFSRPAIKDLQNHHGETCTISPFKAYLSNTYSTNGHNQ